jgi:hypothetical protein
LNLDIELMEQPRYIDCRRAPANYGDIAASEDLEIVMSRAMRYKFRRDARQTRWDMVKIPDTHSEDDSSGNNFFSVFQ